MNEQLLNQLAGISTELLEWFKTSIPEAKNFASEQIPLVIQELITYYRVWYTICSSIMLAGIFLLLCIAKKIINLTRADPNWNNASTFVSSIFGGLLTTTFLIALSIHFVASLDHTIKAWVAPRVFLVEYITDIVKDNSGSKINR